MSFPMFEDRLGCSNLVPDFSYQPRIQSNSRTEPGTFGIFYFFNSKNWFFAFLTELIWLGVGFLNRTGAEIGY